MRQTYRIRTLSYLLVFLSLINFSFAAFSQSKRRVLFINSYHPGFPTFSKQIEGIRSVLDTMSVDLDVEFMDSKRFSDSYTQQLFLKSLHNKLKHSQEYDAIITSDDNAFLFVLQHDPLFRNTPVVFCGVNNLPMAMAQNKNPKATGIIEAVSMDETISLIFNLYPKAKKLYAIVDATPSGQSDLQTYQAISKNYPNKALELIDLRKLTFKNYIKSLQKIPKDTPVLLISSYCDSSGKAIDFENSLRQIKTNLKAPLFHLWYHGMGDGILGGKLISHHEQGKNAALEVHKILSGIDVASIPVNTTSPNKFIFDFKELKKHNISINSLPKNSLIINQPQSFYRKNKRLIYIALFVFFIMSISLVFLSLNILKRKRIETKLHYQNEEYALLNEEYLAQNEELSEAKLKAEESDHLKTAFLNNLSHEVRTPLNGILGFAQIMTMTITPEKRSECIEMLRQSTDNLIGTIDSILTVAQIQTNQVNLRHSVFSLSQLFDGLISEFDKKRKRLQKHEITIEKKNQVNINLNLDYHHIKKLLAILLDNALKFTKKGSIKLSYELTEENIEFKVSDTGIGFPDGFQNQVFKPFTKAPERNDILYGGLGLGLTICVGLIQMMNGELRIESKTDVGSTLFVSLPKNWVLT